MNKPIHQTASEFLQALLSGVLRYYKATLDGRQEIYGSSGEPVDSSAIGACGERVLAKYLNVYCAGQTEPDYEGDVAGWQVRTSRWPNGHLTIHPRDRDDQAFVLITGPERHATGGVVFTIRGYYFAGDAKQRSDWWAQDKRGKAWYVPQDHLLPIETVKAPRRVTNGQVRA